MGLAEGLGGSHDAGLPCDQGPADDQGLSVTADSRLLALTRYSRLGASSRVRMLQFLPSLEAAGFRVAVSPFFDDEYLRALYSQGARRRRHIAAAYLRRLRALLSARRYDLIWVEKELFPFLPGPFEAWLRRAGVPYVVDYDDATFHTYDLHPSGLVRRTLGNKLRPLLSAARMITVGNSYLADYAKGAGARNVQVVPTVVDISRYGVAEEPESKEIRVGWIGSPSTAVLLSLVREPLERLARERPLRLVTIGGGHLPQIEVPKEEHAWSEEREVPLLAGIHVGIMPLQDEPWQRGKCGYKLIQYMACAKPVVASPVGVNTDIVTERVGYLAADAAQWYTALRELAEDAALRNRLGRAGRLAVEERYSLQAVAPRLAGLLRAA
jgi:glycosyltransferase involved in cell wall biosynthesis